jgi:hypothetical protein
MRSDKFEDQYEGTFSEPTLKKSENRSIDNLIFKVLQNITLKK